MTTYVDPCGFVCGIPKAEHQTEEHPWVQAVLDDDDLDSILLALGQLPTWFPETEAKVRTLLARTA